MLASFSLVKTLSRKLEFERNWFEIELNCFTRTDDVLCQQVFVSPRSDAIGESNFAVSLVRVQSFEKLGDECVLARDDSIGRASVRYYQTSFVLLSFFN